MRHVFSANKESHHWPALLRRVITNCAAQHRILSFERIENRCHRGRSVKIDMYFVTDPRQRAEMMREHDANHYDKNPNDPKTKSQGTFKSPMPALKERSQRTSCSV